MYIINFLAIAALPLAIAGYHGHLAAKVVGNFDWKRAVRIMWTMAFWSVCGGTSAGVRLSVP
jgi:hypothetical protein